MNLPPPFQSAKGLKPNARGSIDLINAKSKPLARVPLSTAFELSPEVEGGSGYSYGYGDGYGYGCGSDYGCGDGYGDGYGNGSGHGYGYGCGHGCYGDGQPEGDGGRSP